MSSDSSLKILSSTWPAEEEEEAVPSRLLLQRQGGGGPVNRGSVQGPVMSVEKHVLAAVVSSLAELCSLYGQPDNAKLFYEK